MSDSLEQHRIEKLQQLKEAGFNPYGSRFPEGTPVDELTENFEELEDSKVCGKGRILAVRNFGKATFIDIHDRTGKVQVYLKKGHTDDRSMELFTMLDIGDIIAVHGKLGRTRTGEVTIFADSIDIMSKSLLPPPEKWHGLKDVEIRYRQRWVDLFSSHEVMEDFRLRTEIIRRVRNFLDDRGFLEVETPMMQPIPGGAAAKPFITHHNALDMDLYLRVSPEIFLKKLLVGGMERVYEINRSFRNEGISTRHNPEFTMIEIYQAYGNYIDMMDLTEGIILDALKALPEERKPKIISDVESPWPRRKYAELLREFADLDIFDEEAIKAKALDLHLDGIEGLPPQAVAHKIFEESVEPNLLGPIFVTHYPVVLCPLAKESAEEPGFAERFELYINSMEVANAYSELNDALEQDKRFHHQIDTGEGELRMVDDSFVNALKYGMPPAGGLGIGIDRLMMLLLDRHSIRDVILFPLLKERGKTNV